MIPQRFYTPQEVSVVWRVSRSMVYTLIQRGELKAIRIGHLPRITEEAMREYVDRRAQDLIDAQPSVDATVDGKDRR